jgi:hypothetical protein
MLDSEIVMNENVELCNTLETLTKPNSRMDGVMESGSHTNTQIYKQTIS